MQSDNRFSYLPKQARCMINAEVIQVYIFFQEMSVSDIVSRTIEALELFVRVNCLSRALAQHLGEESAQ